MSDDQNLVSDGDFTARDASEHPSSWSIWNPIWSEARCTVSTTPEGLSMSAPDRPFAVGGAIQQIDAIRGGQTYAFSATCRIDAIPYPLQSIIVRVTWRQGDRLLHPAGTMLRGPIVDGDIATFADTFAAPAEADTAELSLELKWPRDGRILWQQISMRPAEPIPPRKVKVGTVYLQPCDSTPERNLELFAEQVEEAGKLGLDIVCLPEAILQVGSGTTIRDNAEPIPGPSTDFLGKVAVRYGIWVVVGLTEKVGDTVYNTAALIDRSGKVAGTYRKIHLPREEWRQGIEPGDQYPLFRTDFGTIAIQICYDWFFPEPEAIWGMRGAQILFAPTWGNTWADQDGRVEGETTFRVRARDNGIYIVPSVYSGNSMIIDPLGRILVSSEGASGLFWCEIDLDDREPLPWVGHWRAIGVRDRMPHTYDPLFENPHQPR